MKTFRTFVKEETTPTSGVTRGVIDINNAEVRDTINAALGAAFGQGGISSPLQAITVAQKVLANYHIFLPKATPPASNRGQLVFPADQFGAKVGMNDDGRMVSVDPAPYSIVLKYNVVFGRFWATCELVANGAINEEVVYEEVETLDEVSKSTLKSYIKKASHDVATKSAATGRYGDRANRVSKEIKQGNYANWQQGKEDDKTADKFFKKSWKRRMGIAKAVDKLNETEQLDEISGSKAKAYLDAAAKKPVIWKPDEKTRKKSANRAKGEERAQARVDRDNPDHEAAWNKAKDKWLAAQSRYTGRMDNHPDYHAARKEYEAARDKYTSKKKV